MQQDVRDRFEVLKFDFMEDTVGSWLRTMIRRLEGGQVGAGDRHAQPKSSPAYLRKMSHQK